MTFMKHYAPNPFFSCQEGFISFQCPNLQRAITLKNKITFLLNFHQIIYSSSSSNWSCLKLLDTIIFEISWWQVFNDQNLQRAIPWKNKITFFFNFHQVIYSLSSISWLSLKLLAVIVFEISWLQVLKAKICKGQ